MSYIHRIRLLVEKGSLALSNCHRADADEISGDGFLPYLAPNPVSRFRVSLAATIRISFQSDDLVAGIAFNDADMTEVEDDDVARLCPLAVVEDDCGLRAGLGPTDHAVGERRLGSPFFRRGGLEVEPLADAGLVEPLSHAPVNECRAPWPIIGREVGRFLKVADRCAVVVAAHFADSDLRCGDFCEELVHSISFRASQMK